MGTHPHGFTFDPPQTLLAIVAPGVTCLTWAPSPTQAGPLLNPFPLYLFTPWIEDSLKAANPDTLQYCNLWVRVAWAEHGVAVCVRGVPVGSVTAGLPPVLCYSGAQGTCASPSSACEHRLTGEIPVTPGTHLASMVHNSCSPPPSAPHTATWLHALPRHAWQVPCRVPLCEQREEAEEVPALLRGHLRGAPE